MRAGQRMTTRDGVEVALFPFERMIISQGENEGSHINAYIIDCVGSNGNNNYYAPVTLRCISDTFDPTANARVYQSTQKVQLANGMIDYLCVLVAHDDNPPYRLGDIVPQGNLLGHTGNAGISTGAHCHLAIGQGEYQGFTRRGTWHYQGQDYPVVDFTNHIHCYDGFFDNDTEIIQGYGYPWKKYDGGVVPPTPSYDGERKKFPWVAYLRNK